MGPQGEDLLKQLVVRDGTALLKVLLKVLLKAGASGGLVRGVLAGMNPQGEDLLKLFARDGTAGRLSCYSTFDRITSGVVPIRVIADIL